MAAHAKLGASSSHRWMACPGSIRACEGLPDEGQASAYATEGTVAHELAELCLRQDLNTEDLPLDGEWVKYPQDMREYVQTYLDVVRGLRAEVYESKLSVEERLDYSDWVPEGFGTADALIVGLDEIVVVDLKYGKGVRVDAEGNSQARLYALGALSLYELSHDFKRVRSVIVQPRLDHVSEEVLSVDELRTFGEVVRQAAERALAPDAPLVPGEKQCRFCNAKRVCKARAEQNMVVAATEFGFAPSPDRLDLAQIAELLPKMPELIAWANDVQDFALDRALAGEHVPGYKIVEGRSLRRWRSEAEFELEGHPYASKLFSRKLVGIGEAEKILGKHSEQLAVLTEKPPGKPVLVPESDKRAPIQGIQSAIADFS